MKQGVKGKLPVIILAVLLIISLSANGILAAKLAAQPEPQPVDPNAHLYDPDYAIGADNTATVTPETTEPAPAQEISNPYIALVCPADLGDRMRAVTTEEETGISMAFSGEFDGEEVALFTICLTTAEPEGYLLGEFQHETDGRFNVDLRVHEIDPEKWSEEKYGEISAMQERVNDIIVQFYEDTRFTPTR